MRQEDEYTEITCSESKCIQKTKRKGRKKEKEKKHIKEMKQEHEYTEIASCESKCTQKNEKEENKTTSIKIQQVKEQKNLPSFLPS